MINNFRGKYFFLSNFYEADVSFGSYTFKNNEAAFQAQKDTSSTKDFINLNPSQAKKLGRHVRLRKDWEQIKDSIMFEIVTNKFSASESLKEKLLATGTEELVEGNTWGDKYWGVCNGVGKNKLGKILMQVREGFQCE